mgnify:CR=1 FL=1
MGEQLKRYIPALFVWFIMLIVGAMKSAPILLQGGLPGNDDYMRLAVVRDMLGGQGFWDMSQYRLFPPDPLQSHWSRLPDIFIGGLIKFLTPLFGQGGAELAAIIIFPAILLLVMLCLVTAIARRLSDSEWMPLCAALMAGMCFPLLNQFMPGRIDHHGLQIVLAMGAALSLLKAVEKPIYGWISGALCGLSLWLGIEGLPYIIALCGAAGTSWALREQNSAAVMRRFGMALFGSLAICLIISRPPSLWFAPVCDALSPVYLLLGGAIALAMTACSYLTDRLNSLITRLATISGSGLLAVVATVAIFPQCLKGPYAELDPLLQSVWLENVAEAKPFLTFAPSDIVTASALIVLPLLALLGLKFNPDGRRALGQLWLNPTSRLLWIAIVVTFLAGLIQLRLMTFVGAFAAPLAALTMCWAVNKADRFEGDVKRAFARAGAILLLSPIVLPGILMGLTQKSQIDDVKSQIVAENGSVVTLPSCQSPLWLKQLDKLPKGFALTQIDLGAPILVSTQHSVSSAPYHRNEAGNIAALKVFAGSPEKAKLEIEMLSPDYIIACKDFPETSLIKTISPNGLLPQLIAGKVPSWLEPVDMGKRYPLLVYRVVD